jgi:hypothetical protein
MKQGGTKKPAQKAKTEKIVINQHQLTVGLASNVGKYQTAMKS